MATRYQAADVAACIINMAIESGNRISNLQLQKILYFCQCKYIQQYQDKLFDDDIVAWQYGPVVRDVYYAYSYRGASWITESDTTTIDKFSGKPRGIRSLSGDALKVVREVYDIFRGSSAWDLVNRSHVSGGAWDRVYNLHGKASGYGCVIPRDLMESERI